MNIALIGYGKMGKAIEEIAISKGHTIVLKINSQNVSDFTQDNIRQAEVCIEFTHPESALTNILTCLHAGVPVVSGSTGWLPSLSLAHEAAVANNTAFLYASNFSIGVNLFFKLNEYLANLMKEFPEYKIQLEEIHHTQKKDAPSGTGIHLAEQILSCRKDYTAWVNHHSTHPHELPIISKRTDPAPGTHTVLYKGSIDTIEIKHTAHNRLGFASGALMAAEFLLGKKGIYSMSDVLQFDRK
jgi:dihydrodipicolinate reductase